MHFLVLPQRKSFVILEMMYSLFWLMNHEMFQLAREQITVVVLYFNVEGYTVERFIRVAEVKDKDTKSINLKLALE